MTAKGLLTSAALVASILMGATNAQANTGNTGELLLRIGEVVAVGGFFVYDGAATVRQERASIVLLAQGAIVLPIAINNGLYGSSSRLSVGAQTFWLFSDALMNQEVLFGPFGAFSESNRLPALYGLSWGAGLNLAGTLLLLEHGGDLQSTARATLAVNGAVQPVLVGTLAAADVLSADDGPWFWTAAGNAAWALGIGAWALFVGDSVEQESNIHVWLSPMVYDRRDEPSGLLLQLTGRF